MQNTQIRTQKNTQRIIKISIKFAKHARYSKKVCKEYADTKYAEYVKKYAKKRKRIRKEKSKYALKYAKYAR